MGMDFGNQIKIIMILIKDNIVMIKNKVMVNIYGILEQFILVISQMI
jgi:hypothetical protein